MKKEFCFQRCHEPRHKFCQRSHTASKKELHFVIAVCVWRDQIISENRKPFILIIEIYMKTDQSPKLFCVQSFTTIIRLWQWE